ncbi:MAG: S-adenosylmethionine:tRNA ribosyltransferase-isomerase [Bacteroidia bacterium]|nr:S-adenosylmethionine:tRNA ribosyltransferase-isomerase [Bacteroidia bacterium]
MPLPKINIQDFSYDLPLDRIAQYPLSERDASRLLCWIDGKIKEDRFRNIASYIPQESLMVFNNTRVIRARLLFQKTTGTHVEIFCLEPLEPTQEINHAFQQKGPVTWKCLIGNARRWKTGILEKVGEVAGHNFTLQALRMKEMEDGTFSVAFSWHPSGLSFGEVLEGSGRIPLPPYISREDGPSDLLRYQTIYALQEGSVAAPTAGLHFTPAVMDMLNSRNILQEQVTLHVGLGTFRPVTAPDLSQHIMHQEQIVVQAGTIRQLLHHLPNPVIAVGTTSVRTLESLYWLGAGKLKDPELDQVEVRQWEPYIQPDNQLVPAAAALQTLLRMMERSGLTELTATTKLLIMPGYKFRIIHGMITNFHQPRSTLLLLIAAFLGHSWRGVYSYALKNGFRFLSYGDSCLFINDQPL